MGSSEEIRRISRKLEGIWKISRIFGDAVKTAGKSGNMEEFLVN